MITASSSNQNWTWRSQRPHPVASSQCQGLTQILSPSLIIGNLHEEFNLLQLAHFSCGWRCFTWSQKRWIRIPWCLSREVEFHWNLMVASRLIVCTSLSMYRMLHRYQLALVVNVTLLFSLQNVPYDQVLIWRGPSKGGTSETWYPRSIVKWWEFSWASLLLCWWWRRGRVGSPRGGVEAAEARLLH